MTPNPLLLASVDSFLRDLPPDQRFVLAIIMIGCVTAVLIVGAIALASAWAHIRQSESQNELTRDLLDQGKTAEEIERILKPADGFSRAIGNWGKKK